MQKVHILRRYTLPYIKYNIQILDTALKRNKTLIGGAAF